MPQRALSAPQDLNMSTIITYSFRLLTDHQLTATSTVTMTNGGHADVMNVSLSVGAIKTTCTSGWKPRSYFKMLFMVKMFLIIIAAYGAECEGAAQTDREAFR